MAWPGQFLVVSRLLRGPALWMSRRVGGFDDLEHVGRRSGRTFHTPVRAVRRDGRVIIGVTFGDADWVRNVMAAGHCRLRSGAESVVLTAPRSVPTSEVTHLLPPVTRFILRRLARAERCLVLDAA